MSASLEVAVPMATVASVRPALTTMKRLSSTLDSTELSLARAERSLAKAMDLLCRVLHPSDEDEAESSR